MWIQRAFFETVMMEQKQRQDLLMAYRAELAEKVGALLELRTQKAKDDMTLDWLRHRVNALEKQNAQFLTKIAGVPFAAPEIVQTLPGLLPTFETMPAFEDVGDQRAQTLGIVHDEDGNLVYTK